MNLKKTNIELITGLLNKAANIQRYKRELAKINMLEASKIEIKQAEKDFNELVTEAYYIAFADGRLADLLDDIKLMQKNPEEYVFNKEPLEIIMHALQEKQKQHLKQSNECPLKMFLTHLNEILSYILIYTSIN